MAISWRNRIRRRRWHEERKRELEAYIEIEADALRAQGYTPADARHAAERKLGNRTLLLEDIYLMNSAGWFDRMVRDLRLSLRLLRKAPGFSLVVIFTLALGIGASTAIFSVMDTVLLKPLPYPDAERIIMPLRQVPPHIQLGYDAIPWGVNDYKDLSSSAAFAAVGAFKPDAFNLTGAGAPSRLDGLRASAGLWPALGLTAALGRTFNSTEDQPGHEHVVVLGDAVWRKNFNADPAIVGRTIDLNATPYTVVGVMPAGFDFPRAAEMPPVFNFAQSTQIWVPLAPTPPGPNAPDELAVIARLAPGATLPQAQAAMRLFTARRVQQYPRAADWYNSQIQTLGRTMAGDTRRPLLLLQAAVLLLLLTSCANGANLLLTRGLARTREFTLRVALGAPRGRLVRQLLTESIVLSACGGLAGVFIAELAVAAARRFGPGNLPRLREVGLNPMVLGFAVALSFATGILFGLAPALSAARVRLATALNSGGARVSGGAHTRLRQALLVAEVALALVLVVSAGLLSRSFENLLRADGGFNPDRVVSFELTLPAQTYTADEQIPPVYQRILAELRRLPGVRAAGLAAVVPMAGAANSTGIRLPGHTLPPHQRPFAAYTIVSPGYFAAAGTPLLRGRDFAPTDGPASPPVTVISAAMAARFWPGQNPIGQMVGPGSAQYALTRIIGIVADTKRLSMSEVPGPEMFVLYNQHPWPDMHTMDFLVRSDAPALTLGPALAKAAHRVDPNLPLANLRTIAELVSESMAGARLALALMAGFGFLALLTAVVGMYSVTAFGVRQREKDIGIRMALGARPRDVFAAVLRQGAALAALGVAVGLLAALGLTRLFAALLYGVAPADPATFAVVAAILLATALAACYVPARRATRLDPLAALRAE